MNTATRTTDDLPTAASTGPAPLPVCRPQIRLDFYDSAIIISRYASPYTEPGGSAVTAYPVSAADVANACAQLSISSGLLPPETLFWRRSGLAATLAIFVPARRWRVQLGAETYHIPLPPFIFSGCGRQYHVYAVKERPSGRRAALYHLPSPNVNGDGKICAGGARFPECRAESINDALHLFVEGSRFNNDLSANKCRDFPQNVAELWPKLDGKRRFRRQQLVPMGRQLHELL